MIPYLLAALGGYLIGESQKKDSAEAPQMADGGRILVGRFDENQLRNGEDKKAIEKKMKETGLKYIDSRIIKKNGKPHIMEVYLYADGGMMAKGGKIPEKEIESLKKNVYKWYGKDGMTANEEDAEFVPPVTEEEIEVAVKEYVKYCNREGVDKWGGGDSFDREVIVDIMLYNRNPENESYFYPTLIKEIKSTTDLPPIYAKGGLTDEIKLYYHKTSGGAEYLCSSKVKGTKGEGSFDSKYTVRIDGAKKQGGELYIKDEIGREEIKLYYHKTSGGAEYLMSSTVEGTDEGSFDSEFIVRIDGAKNKGGELQVGKIKMPMVYAKGGSVETGAARMKIKLKDGIISVYHSDGSKLLSWKAKKGDWDKIWDRFNYLGHQMAKGGELGAAEIKVELKNGNINIFHSDGRKLYGWKANSGDWDEIWDRLYELSGKEMEDGGMMAQGGVLEHGLREDDRILVERGRFAGIKNDKTGEKFIVDIEEGTRTPSRL